MDRTTTDVRRTVRARNTAEVSENKIHDDAVARDYGFAGGLVPGVDVYAYTASLPARRWGLAWLERGTMTARFVHPVYDGDVVDVVGVGRRGDDGDGLELTLQNRAAATCATGTATLPEIRPPAPDPREIPSRPLPQHRPPASPEAFAIGQVLGSLEFGFHAAHAAAYLDGVGEDLALYADGAVAHPAWLLRSANFVLAANVRLGPWIHASSSVAHHSPVHDGERLSTRARVADHFERSGHRFVVLDVLVVAGETRPVLRAEHTAIYGPRRV